ncbi:gumN family protein [Asticcacaulis biprosthecium C19]|uniref:GumN family protein n=1 Tax=Asticcacaulis biprosthecium C19 TaxID=715226 RepID=F4QGN6_9CAUL|nr:TraB/GumN family protein [Asticcacaulis biprosthecium]EGF92488.1 gumN family protein [Asticcacaulis biprosthecium C19]
MVRTVLAALLALSFSFVAPAVSAKSPIPADKVALASPTPLMWVIRDKDSTIYLFGSVHAMRDGVNWLTPAIQERFDQAGEVWLEVADMDDQTRLVAVARAYMVNPANNMTDGLTGDEIADLDRRLPPCGYSRQAMMGMRKWAVGLMLVQCEFATMGLDPDNGIDITLMRRAQAASKPVHGLETMEEQMDVLAPDSEAEELQTLRSILKELDDTPEMVDQLITAWLAGDVKTLERHLVADLEENDPTGYKRMIAGRNHQWVPKIKTILDGEGTVFIAVGAGHLVGPDSVITLLKKQGIKAKKVRTGS